MSGSATLSNDDQCPDSLARFMLVGDDSTLGHEGRPVVDRAHRRAGTGGPLGHVPGRASRCRGLDLGAIRLMADRDQQPGGYEPVPVHVVRQRAAAAAPAAYPGAVPELGRVEGDRREADRDAARTTREGRR